MQQTGIAHPYLDAAREILPEVIALRRRLHRVPEVGLELPRTQAIVLDAVRGLGLDPVAGVTVGSVVATIEGAGPGPTILLRADMDAPAADRGDRARLRLRARRADARLRARHARRDAARRGSAAPRRPRRRGPAASS